VDVYHSRSKNLNWDFNDYVMDYDEEIWCIALRDKRSTPFGTFRPRIQNPKVRCTLYTIQLQLGKILDWIKELIRIECGVGYCCALLHSMHNSSITGRGEGLENEICGGK
jgi:hypothetical protein